VPLRFQPVREKLFANSSQPAPQYGLPIADAQWQNLIPIALFKKLQLDP
jgi:hypothetical protein